MCVISGFRYKVADNLALWGYYHYSLHNNPKERSSQQLNCLLSNAEQILSATFSLPVASKLTASVCAEMTQDYRQHCGQFNCKSNYC